MVMTYMPGGIAQTPFRDNLRQYVASNPIRTLVETDVVAQWWLDDASGIYAAVHNPALAEGRNTVINGDMGSSTGWTLGANWAISGGLATHTTGSVATLSQLLALVLNRIYKIVFTVSGRTAGSVTVSAGASGTARSSNATFTEYIYDTASTSLIFTPTTDFDGSIDNVTVQEVGIAASSSFPTVELVKNGGFSFEGAAWSAAANWTFTGGKAVHTPGAANGLVNANGTGLIVGRSYTVTYTVSGRTAGQINVQLGSTGTGAIRTTNNTFSETITCSGTTTFSFTVTSAFDGSLDDISLVPADGFNLWNGDGSTTTGWTAANSATLSSVSSWLRVAYNAVANAGATQNSLKLGSTYHLTGSMRGDGTAIPQILNAAPLVTGTGSGSTQAVDLIFVATGIQIVLRNTTSSGYVEFQNLVLTELPPMIGTQANGILINQTSGNSLLDPVTWDDGVNDTLNCYSGALNSAFTPTVGSLEMFAKVNAVGVWTDATQRNLVTIGDGTNNRVVLQKTTTNNQLRALYVGGGTNTQVTTTVLAGITNWFHICMTWDVTGNVLSLYINGVLVGTASTFGTWAANLVSTACAIGSSGATGSGPWSGWMSQVRLYNAVLTPDRVMLHAQLGGAA